MILMETAQTILALTAIVGILIGSQLLKRRLLGLLRQETAARGGATA